MRARSVRLIPYVCGAGASKPGQERGPLALQNNGLLEAVRGQGLDVSWQDDPARLFESSPWGRAFHESLPPRGDPARLQAVLWHTTYIRDQVRAVLGAGVLPVTIGGDHSMAAGSVAGLAQAYGAQGRIGLLWIDAHADINTPQTTVTQALHGMPIAALLGKGDPALIALGGGDRPVLDPRHICYIGLRDVDPPEVDALRALGITAFWMADVVRDGLQNVLEQALAVIRRDTDRLFLSIDLDAFDPQDAPGVGSPEPGGLRAAEALPLLGAAARQVSFDVIEIAEYNPVYEREGKTAALVEDLLEKLLRGYPI